jgi:hypothetical protein
MMANVMPLPDEPGLPEDDHPRRYGVLQVVDKPAPGTEIDGPHRDDDQHRPGEHSEHPEREFPQGR